MVKDFKQRGVPIDGIGLQMHISRLDFDTAAIGSEYCASHRTRASGSYHGTRRLTASRLEGTAERAADLQQQAEIYRGVVRACLQNPGCTAIQTWGFTDKYSWIGSHSHGTRGAALPFDRAYKPKPAYDAMLTRSHPPTTATK